MSDMPVEDLFADVNPTSLQDLMADTDRQDMDLVNYLNNDEELNTPGDEPDSGSSEDSEATIPATPYVGSSDGSPAEMRRQTRSRTASVVSRLSDETPSDTENTTTTGKENSVGFPRVVLYGYRSIKKHMGESVKGTSDQAQTVSSDEEPDVAGNENSSSIPLARPYRQKKVIKPSKTLITLTKKKTEHTDSVLNTNKTRSRSYKSTDKTQSNKKRKSQSSSFQILRIKKSGDDNVDNPDNLTEAMKAYNIRNAEMARENRVKKKVYVENLEQEVRSGQKQIVQLKLQASKAEGERDSLAEEVQYLRSVLANQSLLARLLRNIPEVTGAALSSSMVRKRGAKSSVDCPIPAKKRKSPGGVCLHVDDGVVSLEACQKCADMAWGSRSTKR
ncbi:hypothetical protein ACOMHN_023837 [Nucella lapillus]